MLRFSFFRQQPGTGRSFIKLASRVQFRALFLLLLAFSQREQPALSQTDVGGRARIRLQVQTALKHNYLTYALIEEGLKANEADADGDGQLLLGEWLEYAKRRVPRMRQGQTVGTGARPNKSLEEAGAPEEEGVVQRPRVFYRREPELQPFVVAKPGARAPVRSSKEGAR